MCKVFAITDMSRVEVTQKLIKVAKRAVTKYTDKHGFGYAVLSTQNEIGGERTTKIDSFEGLSGPLSKSSQLPFVEKHSNIFGKLTQVIQRPKSFVAHGRFSTNSVSLQNTHPFYNKSVAMIHNGVVRDYSGHVKSSLKTDNDTEILLRYWERGGMQEIEKNVTGYYALAVLDTEGKLHIIRDSKASLYLAWCRTINSYMVATTEEILHMVAKGMRWKIERPELILDNTHVVFDGNDFTWRGITPLEVQYDVELAQKAAAAFNETRGAYIESGHDDVPKYKEYYTPAELGDDDGPESISYRELVRLDNEAALAAELDDSYEDEETPDVVSIIKHSMGKGA